jgi:hypothetical protein
VVEIPSYVLALAGFLHIPNGVPYSPIIHIGDEFSTIFKKITLMNLHRAKEM